MTRTLYLVVARAGSKGVPGKNARILGGRSLIQWKIDAADALLEGDDEIWISTESENLAALAKLHDVQWLRRPDYLASDTASSASVIQHALENLPGFDRVMLLEPSAPFATTEHMREAIKLYDTQDADLVVGMKETEPSTAFIGTMREDRSINPIIVSMRRYGGNLRRQDLQPEWTMNGSLYLFSTRMFLETGSIYGGVRNFGLLMDWAHSIEIDTLHDLELAEFAVAKGYV